MGKLHGFTQILLYIRADISILTGNIIASHKDKSILGGNLLLQLVISPTPGEITRVTTK